MSSQPQNSQVAIAVAAITATSGLGVAMFNNWDRLFPKSEPEEKIETPLGNQRIKVHFDIREENENPISDAEVRFVFEGAPIFKKTDLNGYTSIELPKIDGIEVTIRKQGFLTQRLNVNLIAESNVTRTVYLTREESQELNSADRSEDLVDSDEASIQDLRESVNLPDILSGNNVFQSSSVWRSETNKTRLPGLDKICFGEHLIENIETVFGYNNPPFSGTVYVRSPKQEGCFPGDTLQGSFDLTGSKGNCIGDIIVDWSNMNRAHIRWAINNLGTSCPVGTKDWEILVYPVQN